MQKKIGVQSAAPQIPLQDGWTAFCSKSTEDTFIIVMYNKDDCRTSMHCFDIRNFEEQKLLLGVEAFIRYCMQTNQAPVTTSRRKLRTPKTK